MSTVPHFAPAEPRYRRRRMSLATCVRQGWETLQRWRRMQRALGELRDLDDRLLDDIGLSRSTLYSSVRERHGFRGQRFARDQ